MANANCKRQPGHFLDELRRYVLAPLSEAERIVDRERGEISAERDAFEEFTERLTEIDPVAEPPIEGPSLGVIDHEATVDPTDRVRTGYRDTVMNVPHYDDVYGESLIENIAGEFGPELAECISPEGSVPWTQSVKSTLSQAAWQGVRERREFIDILDVEARSIERARSELTELVSHLDTTIIPDWYQETFVDHLDTVARERQEILWSNLRMLHSREDDLCSYLYRDEAWTYPVLTAVTRIRESVVLSESSGGR